MAVRRDLLSGPNVSGRPVDHGVHIAPLLHCAGQVCVFEREMNEREILNLIQRLPGVQQVCVCVSLQVLRYLLPAAGLQTQDDPAQSGGDAQWLLAHPDIHLLSTHHAKLERHRHRGHCESSAAEIGNQKAKKLKTACYVVILMTICYGTA